MKKILWSFWDGPLNRFVEEAQESWKKYLPDWDIRLLNKHTVRHYTIKLPRNYEEQSIQKKSDVIRLSLLYNHGGLWMDATIILNQNLDWLIEVMKKYPYYAYQMKRKYIENWFIAVRNPRDYSIGKWRDTFLRQIDDPESMSITPCKRVQNDGFYYKDPTYFDCYYSYCYLLHTDTRFRDIHDSIDFLSVNVFGEPFYNFFKGKRHGKLVKFTHWHRKNYKWSKFPLMYLYVGLLLAAIAGIILVFHRALRRKY